MMYHSSEYKTQIAKAIQTLSFSSPETMEDVNIAPARICINESFNRKREVVRYPTLHNGRNGKPVGPCLEGQH